MSAGARSFTPAQAAQQVNRTEGGQYKELSRGEADVSLAPTPLLTPGRFDAEAEQGGSVHFPPVMNTVGESIDFWTKVPIPDDELNSFYRDLARRDLARVEDVHRHWTNQRLERGWLSQNPEPQADSPEHQGWQQRHDEQWRSLYDEHPRPTIEQATQRPALDRRNARTVLRVLLMAETAPAQQAHRQAVMDSLVHLYGVEEDFTVEQICDAYGPEDIYEAMSEDLSQEQLRATNERLEGLLEQQRVSNHYSWMSADANARLLDIEIQNGRMRGADLGYGPGSRPDYL